jgi:hypothetical protein
MNALLRAMYGFLPLAALGAAALGAAALGAAALGAAALGAAALGAAALGAAALGEGDCAPEHPATRTIAIATVIARAEPLVPIEIIVRISSAGWPSR